MSYLKTDGGSTVVQYPYTAADFRAEHPNVSLFPAGAVPRADQLAEFNIFEVASTAKPSPSDPITKNVTEAAPTLVGDVWTQAWTEENASAEEIANRQQATADSAAAVTIKADTFVQNFIAMTPAEVSAYIDANVTDLASAKSVIEKMGIMLLLLARREFR